MNTLKIEAKLAEKYKYKPLPGDLSLKYRQFFLENLPEWISVNGAEKPLYTSKGTKIFDSYDRVVIGDYGAFIEFKDMPMSSGTIFVCKRGQEYRIFDPQYNTHVKYYWLTIEDGSNIKIYLQKRTVSYADYLPERYYVSVHEAFPVG